MSDLKLSVTTDTSPVQQDLDHLNKKIDSLGASADRMGGKVAAAGGRMSGSIKESTAAASRLDSALSSVASTAAAAAAAVAATGGAYALTSAADEATNLRNKLALVADEHNTILELQAATYKLSGDTRSSLKDTVALYATISQAMKEGYAGQANAATVTSAINKSLQLSGVSAESAGAAIMQLSQGLSAGVLRGEELNSVIEQTPRLARAIAAGMGVGVGKLRELGEAGALTASAVIDAIAGQSQVLDREFSKTSATVAQGGARIAEAMRQSVGEVDRLTGASASVSGVLSKVAGGIDSAAGSMESRLARLTHSVRMTLVDIATVSSDNFGVTDAFKYAKGLVQNAASATREIGSVVTQLRIEEGYDFMDRGLQKVEGKARSLGYQMLRLHNRFVEFRRISASIRESWGESQLKAVVSSVLDFVDIGGRVDSLKDSLARIQTPAGMRDAADSFMRLANSVGFTVEAIWRVLPKVDTAYASMSDRFNLFARASSASWSRFTYSLTNSWKRFSINLIRSVAGDGVWAKMAQDAYEFELSMQATNFDSFLSGINRLKGAMRQSSVYQFAEAIGLLRHKLIEFDGIDFAGMRNELRRLGRDITRTFNFNIRYPMARIIRSMRATVLLTYSAFVEGWNDTFNSDTGDALGGAIHRILKSALVSAGLWIAGRGSQILADAAKGKITWRWLFGSGMLTDALNRMSADLPLMMANLYAFIVRAARAAVHGEESWLDVMLKPYKRLGTAITGAISKSLGLSNPMAPLLSIFSAAGNMIDNLITRMVGGKFNRMMLRLLPRSTLVRHLTGQQRIFTSLSGLTLAGVSFDKVGASMSAAFTNTMILADKTASAIRRFDAKPMVRDLQEMAATATRTWRSFAAGAEQLWHAVEPALRATVYAVSQAFRRIEKSAESGWLRKIGVESASALHFLAGLDYGAIFSEAKGSIIKFVTSVTAAASEGFAAAVRLFEQMVDGVTSYAPKLKQAYESVREFLDNVIAGFYRVWDEVVGHCYWPDMVDGVIEWAQHMLQVGGALVARFTTFVTDNFKKLPGIISGFLEKIRSGEITWDSVGESIGVAMGKALEAAKRGAAALHVEMHVQWGNANEGLRRLTEWLSRQLSFALFTGLVLFLGGGAPVVLGLLTHAIFSSVIDPIEKGLASVVGPSGVLGEVSHTLGRGAAVFAQTLWSSALDYVSMLHRIIPEFFRGFLSELGIIGTVFHTILDTVFLSLDNPLVAILFGAAALAAYKDGFKGVASVWEQSLASVKVIKNTGKMLALTVEPQYAGLEAMGRPGQQLRDMREAMLKQSAVATQARDKMISAASAYERFRDAEAVLSRQNAQRISNTNHPAVRDYLQQTEAKRKAAAQQHLDMLQQQLKLAREVSKAENAAASRLSDEAEKYSKTLLPNAKGSNEPVTFSPFMLVAGLLTLSGAMDNFQKSTGDSVDKALGAFAGLATGIPLLLASVMGPEGAVRIIADGGAKIRAGLMALFIPPASGSNQLLAGVKTAGLAVFHAAVETADASTRVLRNFLDNRRDYAMGNISFTEMLLGKNEAQHIGLGATLTKAWSDVKAGITDIRAWAVDAWADLVPRFAASGAVLSQAWSKGAVKAAAAGSAMKAELVSVGVAMTAYWANLRSAITGLIAKFGQSGVLSSLLYGRGGKSALIAGLLLVLSLLSTAANASSSVHDALKDARGSKVGADYTVADGVMDLGGALLTGIPFFTALPHLLRGDIKGAFVSVLEVVKDLGRNMKGLGIGAVGMAKDVGAIGASLATTAVDAWGAWKYGHGKAGGEQKAPAASTVKREAPVGLFSTAIADTVNAWHFARMSRREDGPGDAKINPWQAARSQRQWGNYSPIRDIPPSTVTTSGRIKENVGATVDLISTGVNFATSGMVGAVAQMTGMTTLMAGLAVAAGVFAVGGVLSVYMFGEGDGFFQKLENVKDKIAAAVMGVPMDEVADPRAKPLVKALRGPQSEAISQYGFTDKIQALDYKQLSTGGYEELQRRVDAVAASLQSLSSAQYDNADAAAAASAAVNSSADSLDRFLSKQARAKFSAAAATERQNKFLKMVEEDKTSGLERLGNHPWMQKMVPIAKSVGTALFGDAEEIKARQRAMNEPWKAISAVLPSALRNVRQMMGGNGDPPPDLNTALYGDRKVGSKGLTIEAGSSDAMQSMKRSYDQYAMMFSAVDALRETMGSSEQATVDKSVSDFQQAYANLRNLERMGPFKDTAEWDKLNAEFLRAKTNMDAVGGKFIALGNAEKQNADYLQQMKTQWSTWEKVKDSVGATSNDDLEKMAQAGNFMDQSQMNILGSIQARKDDLLNQLLGRDNAKPMSVDIAPRVRLQHEQAKNELKALTEEFNSKLVVSASIEWTVKHSGVELDQDSVLRFYAANREGYDAWRQSVSELARAERDLKDAQRTDDGNTIKLKELIDIRDKAKTKVQQLAPQSNPLDAFQKAGQQWQMPSVDTAQFTANPQFFSGVSEKLKSLNADRKLLDDGWASGKMSVEEYATKLKGLEKVAQGLRDKIVQLRTPLASFQALASSLNMPSVDSESYSKEFHVYNRIKDQLQGVEDQKKQLDEEWSTGEMGIEEYGNRLAELEKTAASIRKELGRVGKSANELALEALSQFGANQATLFKMGEDKRDGFVMKAEQAQALLKTANTSTNADERAKAGKQYNKLTRGLTKTFESMNEEGSASIFERFSKYAQESGISVSLEQIAVLGKGAQDSLVGTLRAAHKMYKGLSAAPGGNTPANMEKFSAAFKAWKEQQQEFEDKLAANSMSVSDSFGKAFEGAKPEDVFSTLDTESRKRLAQIGVAVDEVERKIGRFTAANISEVDSRMKDAMAQLQRLKNEGAQLMSVIPHNQRMFGVASERFGVTIDDQRQADFSAEDFGLARSLQSQLGDNKRVLSDPSTQLGDWQRAMGEKVRLTKELTALNKTGIARQLELIGLGDVDTSVAERNLDVRSKLVDRMQVLQDEYAEYLSLQRLVQDGSANPDQTTRFNQLASRRDSFKTTTQSVATLSTMSGLLQSMKLDATDLRYLSGVSLTDLASNRAELDSLYAQLGTLGNDQVDQAERLNREIDRRLKMESDITEQVQDRKSLEGTFKNNFSEGLKGVFNGSANLGTITLNVANSAVDSMITRMSNSAFSVLSEKLAGAVSSKASLGSGVMGTGAVLGAWMSNHGEIGARNGALLGLAATPVVEAVAPVVQSAFAKGGVLSSVGDTFRKGGALESVGDFVSGIFGGSATKFDGSSPFNAMWVRLSDTSMFEGLPGLSDSADIIPDESTLSLVDSINEPISKMTDMMSGMLAQITDVLGGLGKSAGGLLDSFMGGSSGGAGGSDFLGSAMQIASAFGLPAFDTGGVVGGRIGAPQLALVHSGETILPTHKKGLDELGIGGQSGGSRTTVLHLNVTGDVSRQTRKEILGMLPVITAGVNSNNRESNYRR